MQQQAKNKIISAVIGNALEWYDFLIYGFLATTIAQLYFPEQNPVTSLLMALATFGVGFLMRPIGGLVLGYYADKKGRKFILEVIIALMTLSVLLITFLPTAASIGIAAPIIMVIARMIQGFATGGEFASSTAYVIEASPANRKGLYGSWQFFGQCLAILFGSGFAALLSHYLSAEAFMSWGWRLLFFVGLLICPVGLWIRYQLDENEAYQQQRVQASQPLSMIAQNLKASIKQIILTIGLSISATAAFYVVLINTPTYLYIKLGIVLSDLLILQAVAVLLLMLVIPLAGLWSDYIGRKPVIILGLSILIVTTLPLYHYVFTEKSQGAVLLMQCVLCVGIGLLLGPAPALVSEQFRIMGRTTAMSIAYNIAVMTFGGFAPFLVIWLSEIFNYAAPAYYLILAQMIGMLAVVLMKDDVLEFSYKKINKSVT
ncbi:MFS transporter [Acinetobacter larvae]|uniref:Major facilitator superfamily (MFS) profile domain-containing protein n=1 Tax=Acinetobacter larvae TaxID=1789224 RepID=A0A1B2M0N1_9GAMM|nr:MFS transporter [Acinetobacter larvae]AOA58764.1 hypothetical protein BFG52_10665 [Acinetobacter larvae]